MINHFRTLLLNQRPALLGDLTLPGAELVPAEFAAVELPDWLRRLHALLFGSQPDTLYLNYRVGQYLTLLHATELAEYLTLFDTRLTYRPDLPDPALFYDAFRASVQQTAGTARGLVLVGTQAADDARGKSWFRWVVDMIGTQATVSRLQPEFEQAVSTPAAASDAVGPLALSATLSAVLQPGADASWNVTVPCRPSRTLGQVFEFVRTLLDAGLAADLFDTARVPVVCGNLYAQHPALPYRLGAVLLALGYQIESLRAQG